MPNPHKEKQLTANNGKELADNRSSYFNTRKMLVFGLLIAIFLGIWAISRRRESSDVTENNSSTWIERWRNENQNQEFEIEQKISSGEAILVGADNNPNKQLAAKKFAAGEFKEAQIEFANSLAANPNDPEALIYLNNSLAAMELKSLKIGVSVPIGGSLNVAKEILRGVAQAQNEINKKGGIEQDGRKRLVQIEIANDNNDPETAKQIATHFVADPEIEAVIGHNSSDASLAAAPIYQAGNLAMISPTSVARELSQAGSYIFRTTPGSRILAETLAQYTVENIRRQKVAVCFDSTNSASMSFKEDFSLSLYELGGEVSSTDCDFASPDFNPDKIPSKAIADGSEALLLVPSVNKITQALEVAKANQNRLSMLGNHSMYTYETLKIGQSDLNSMVIPTAWHPESTADSQFNQNARKLWGMEGSWRTATAYDATKALTTGLRSATTRQELQQTLSNPGFFAPGVVGKISFQPSGDRQIQGTLVKVQPGESSGTGYDFNPIEPSQAITPSKK